MRKEYKFGLLIIYINFSYSEKGYSEREKRFTLILKRREQNV